MSSKGEPPGVPGTAPLQNLLLYVPPPSQQQQQQQSQSMSDRQMQEFGSHHIRHVPSRLIASEARHPAGDKKIIDEDSIIMKNLQRMHYQSSLQNGISIPKDGINIQNVLSINDNTQIQPQFVCKPANEINASNNSNATKNNTYSIGIQNLPQGQRLIHGDVFQSNEKNGDKLGNGPYNSAGLCGNNYMDANQDPINSIASAVSRSDSVRSETGESCSSMSSGDGQSDCSGNILILPGQMPPGMHGSQILGQNQIVINPNPSMLNHNHHPQNNIVLTGNSNSMMSEVENSNHGANYHLMDHNMTQQSIVNQSISIVNHQIISNRNGGGGGGESHQHGQQQDQDRPQEAVAPETAVRQGLPLGMEDIVIVNNMPHQLVRTPGGIVLGVMPGAKHSAVGSSVSLGVVNGVHNVASNLVQQPFVSTDSRQVQPQQPQTQPQLETQFVTVPFRWNRIFNGNSVIYISPSGAALCTLDQVREYLQAAGTCKCGLDCPVRPECTFNFDPKVVGKPYDMRADLSRSDINKSCSYKRKLLAASSNLSSISGSQIITQDDKQHKDIPANKKRKRKANPYSGVSVSQLLAQRENVHQMQQNQIQASQMQLEQYQLQNQRDYQPSQIKDRVWDNSLSNAHLSPLHNPSASASTTQTRFNNGQVVNNYSNGNISIAPQQTNQCIKVENNSCNTEFHGKVNNGTQYLTINGTLEAQQKLLQQQIVFNGQQNSPLRKAPPNVQNNQTTEYNHIMGPNGHIIGIQTSNICRSQSMESISSNGEKCNIKCNNFVPLTSVKSEIFPNIKPADCKVSQNDKNIAPSPQTVQFVQNSLTTPSTQSNTSQLQINQCNMNMSNTTNMQQLTPEVIQRINQQQHIFIQQNQKQMELAMKGMKAQMASGSPQSIIGIRSSVPFSNVNTETLASSQGGMVVSNNSVMVNSSNQSKMPPWQVNRINKFQSNNFIQEQSFQQNKNAPHNQMETTDKNQNPSLISNMNCNINPSLENQGMSLQNQDSQNVFSRVPPLHQHTPQTIWPEEVQRKKTKPAKLVKKSRPYNLMENQRINQPQQNFSNQNNMSSMEFTKSPQDIRLNQSPQLQESFSSNNSSPSFMDDPSGYLAQQTALLNNTISRQVGFNMLCNNSMENNSGMKNNLHNANGSNSNQKYCSPNVNRVNSEKNQYNSYIDHKKNEKVFISSLQSNIPDSSVNTDKSSKLTQQNLHCQGCLQKSNDTICNHQNICDQQLHNANFQIKVHNYIQSITSTKSMAGTQPGTPSPNQSSDESPVTSSTYMDRPGSRSNSVDMRGPIQGGIVSTSNGSPMETFALPELSPTPSNSSRNTDTPLSKNSGSIHISSSCPYTMPSPVYSNQGSSRESMSSNPATPSPSQNNLNYISYSSPGPQQNMPSNEMIISSQMNNDNSNPFNNMRNNINNEMLIRNVINNSNQLNVMNEQMENMNEHSHSAISQHRRIPQPGISGFYVPANINSGSPNPEGQMMFIHSNGMVTTMASGHTLSRNTITSVLAGKAQTATTSINAAASTLPFSYPLSNAENMSNQNIPTTNKNVQFENINVPPDYPVHVAGNFPQNLISKSPLEMVQSVVSSIQVSQSQNCANMSVISPHSSQFQGKNSSNNSNVHPGQILMPANGQYLVSNGNQNSIMAPPPPKGQSVPPLPPISSSPLVTTVTASVTQGISAVGGVQQVMNPPTVLVNTMPAPFMLQPQVMTVDGQMVNQNVQIPQIMTGNLISQGRLVGEQTNEIDRNSGVMSRSNMLSPDSGKKKNKKRKIQNQNVTPMLHIAAQHSPGNLLVQHNTPQQQSQQFSPQGFQVSSNSNMSTTPMLQALTIVPGKPGTPAHIVMNGQGNNGNFGSQQIITNSQGPQHINLLQPVNLLNGTGVVQNFPTFQQFIVPGLGSMVMTADGTAILQDTANIPMQLQIQNVNGQNVLTPVQNQGILTAGTTGMVIRTQNPNNKIIQSQHSPGAQFLSPTGGQIVMSGSPFNGQLSPLVANMSPNHSVTFNTSPSQVRPNIQQEFIQCNQMGQTLMVPLSPNQIAISTSTNQQNTTFVQQNTTIVQQQTTMVSNNHANNQFQSGAGNSNNTIVPALNIDQGMIINQSGKPNALMKARHNLVQIQNQNPNGQLQHPQITIHNANDSHGLKRIAVQYPHIINQVQNNNMKNEHPQQILTNINQNNLLQQFQNSSHPNVRHSVSTQTFVNQQNNDNKSPVAIYQQISGSSPPDTTTHSPLGALENSSSPNNNLSSRNSNSSQGNQVDTTTGSPEPNEHGSLPMVHCISSSEPDNGDQWERNQNEITLDMQGNAAALHHFSNPSQNAFYSIESLGTYPNYNPTITVSSVNNLQNSTFESGNYIQKINSVKYHHQNSVMPPNGNNQQFFDKMTIKNSCMVNNTGLDTQNFRKQITINDNSEKNMMGGDMQRNCNNMNEMASGNYMKRVSVSSANETSIEESTTPSKPDEPDENVTSVVKLFKEGDLVWGPAKGFPAWPGKLISKNLVNGICDGKVLVRWFGGDKCLSAVDPVRLQTLSEGLEAHHAARTKCRKSRKLNSQLEKAIQEAMSELDRITDNSDVKSSSSVQHDESTTSDINGNSSKAAKTAHKNNFDGKNKGWPSKRDIGMAMSKSTRGGMGIVKIAPHPIAGNEVTGRLRSSHR